MKGIREIRLTGLVAALAILAGCAGTPIMIDLCEMGLDRTDFDFSEGRTISAEASGFQVLLFIPIDINDRQQRAYKMLKQKAGDEYIDEIRIMESWTYIFVGTIFTTTLEAKAYPPHSEKSIPVMSSK